MRAGRCARAVDCRHKANKSDSRSWRKLVMQIRPLCFIWFSLLSAALSVRAVEFISPNGDQLPEAEAVVVSATKIDTPINEIGSSVSVINHEEIERNQERTLPDVLE